MARECPDPGYLNTNLSDFSLCIPHTDMCSSLSRYASIYASVYYRLSLCCREQAHALIYMYITGSRSVAARSMCAKKKQKQRHQALHASMHMLLHAYIRIRKRINMDRCMYCSHYEAFFAGTCHLIYREQKSLCTRRTYVYVYSRGCCGICRLPFYCTDAHIASESN
jgi:hypothetical protein